MKFVLITLLFVVILIIFIKFKRRFQLAWKIPGPFFIPFIGCIQFITMKQENIYLLINNMRQKYKRSFRLWLGLNVWVFLHSPEDHKHILNSTRFGRAEDFNMLRPLVGDGLLLSKGKKWNVRRKALNPAFHPKILESFLESFCQNANIFVNNLPENQEIDVSNNIFLCVLDTICETSMGVKINSQINSECVYVKAFHDASHLLFQRIVNPLLRIDVIYKHTQSAYKLNKAIKIIHSLTEKMIKERKDIIVSLSVETGIADVAPEEDEIGIKRNKLALLDILLNTKIDGKPLQDDDIKEEVNTFIFAGVDTTKSSLCFLTYNLSKYPDWQLKIIEEIQTLTGSYDQQQTIDINHLNQMKYLDMFIKESMRYHTTVPLSSRHIKEEMMIGEMLLPANTTVWINMYGLAHDPELFQNPEEFRPERFDNDVNDQKQIIPYSYLPFAGGSRICIGKKYSLLMMKVIIVKLLLAYEMFLARPDEELQIISEMVLKSTTGINLILKRRKNP